MKLDDSPMKNPYWVLPVGTLIEIVSYHQISVVKGRSTAKKTFPQVITATGIFSAASFLGQNYLYARLKYNCSYFQIRDAILKALVDANYYAPSNVVQVYLIR